MVGVKTLVPGIATDPETTGVFQCSVPCGVGQRTRDVKCVSNIGDVVADEECNMKLRPSDIENCDMGPCAKSWFLTEWSERVSMGSPGQRDRNSSRST